MIPMGLAEGHFIIYGTKDKAIKVGMTQESQKWTAPYMYFRTWGWASTDNKILIDKPYTNRSHLYEAVKEVLLKKFFKVDCSSSYIDTRSSKEFNRIFNSYKLRFYPDSVRVDNNFKFKLSCGNREFEGKCTAEFAGSTENSLKQELDRIKEVADGFNPAGDYFITPEGKLVNPKKCPYTGLMIDMSQDKSYYAKYLNNPLASGQDFMAVTYCDGFIRLDTCTNYFSKASESDYIRSYSNGDSYVESECIGFAPRFSPRSMPLKSFKEFIKGHIDKSPYSLIILRVVEAEKNTYIKYKKTGVTA